MKLIKRNFLWFKVFKVYWFFFINNYKDFYDTYWKIPNYTILWNIGKVVHLLYSNRFPIINILLALIICVIFRTFKKIYCTVIPIRISVLLLRNVITNFINRFYFILLFFLLNSIYYSTDVLCWFLGNSRLP